MNLLQYRNRFKPANFTPPVKDEIKGYMLALQDLLSYLADDTKFDPNNRWIDSVKLLQAIQDTSDELKKKLSGIDLGGEKVTSFLREQTGQSNLSKIEQELMKEDKDRDDKKLLK